MRTSLTRFFILAFLTLLLPRDVFAASAEWPSIVERARGQDVYWNAYGGDEKVNRYIQWVAAEVKQRYGVTLHHVKVGNIAETVTQLTAEKAAGRTENGRVDLMWLNGQNFAAMKENRLLFGPFTHVLPRFALVDTIHKPTTLLDFTVPTDGLESPWGMAQLVFFADAEAVRRPPRTLKALREWIVAHPGRFTYPAPPDFTGQTFLKQVLLETLDNREVAYRPVREEDFQRVTAPLWRFIDELHPYLWRKGASFPPTFAAMRQLMSDSEIDIAFAFNPAEASNAVAQKLLPASVRSFVLEEGTIGNTHFVAIPNTATAREGAMVVADFLLSPEAQSRKANPQHWGDPTVLNLERLSDAERQLFDDLPRGRAMPSAAALQSTLSEPHPSWTTRIAQEWRKRYVK
jgi:putative thiamine transport system substrate-binding protein